MTQIKETKPGVYLVNNKEVDTRQPIWGKNLTSTEYKNLQNYRRSQCTTTQPTKKA